MMKVWPGNPFPLGAIYDGAGTNFSIFSEVAERIELCFFDAHGQESCVDLLEVTGHCWHGYFPGIEPGQRYGFRVHGPWDPENGHRCNPAKLLLDPYAKTIDGDIRWNEAVFPYQFSEGPDVRNDADSAPFMPKCIVQQPFFDWSGDRLLKRPWHETIISNCMSKVLRRSTPTSLPKYVAPMPGLPIQPPSTTSNNSASPLWN